MSSFLKVRGIFMRCYRVFGFRVRKKVVCLNLYQLNRIRFIDKTELVVVLPKTGAFYVNSYRACVITLLCTGGLRVERVISRA
jgi:hypothetical protein